MSETNPNGVSMNKFRTDVTKGGYKILSIHGPDDGGCYAGVVGVRDGFLAIDWHRNGKPMEAHDNYSLVPLDEPKPDHTAEHIAELRQCIYSLEDSIKILDTKLHEVKKDAIARVNGLRADYLADTSAVQPSRVDGLEERLEYLEKEIPCDGWFSETEDKLAKVHEIDTTNSLLWSRMSMIQEDLTKRIEALERRSQPSEKGADARNYPHEKGVWITISTLRNVVRSTDLVQGDIGLKALIKRLGLEEDE